MTKTCKNCDNAVSESYCAHCGQSTHVHELNLKFLWHDIEHSLLHIDKGIFYTIKELYTRPGHTIREFIEGKRVKHFKPLSLVMILATIYGFLYHYTDIELVKFSEESNKFIEKQKVNDWIENHFALMSLITLPMYAFGSWISFRKQKFNFVEHFVLNAFLSGQRLVLHLQALPLLMITSSSAIQLGVVSVTSLLDFLLMYWGYHQFFRNLTWIKSLLLTILCYVVVIVGTIAFSTLIVIIYTYFKK